MLAGRAKDDVKTQMAQLVDQTLGAHLWVQAVEIVFPQFTVRLATSNDVVRDLENGVRECNHRLFGPAARRDAAIARCERRLFHMRRRLRGLDKHRTQPGISFARATAALLAGALVVSWSYAHPRRQRRSRREATHVRADFRHQYLCRGQRDAGDRVQQRHNCRLVRIHRTGCLNLGIKTRNRLVQAVELRQQLGEHETVVGPESAVERLFELWALLPELASC